MVVNDLEDKTKRVVRGSKFFIILFISEESIFETKWIFGPSWYSDKALVTNLGPSSEPPIPMLTTSVK